MFGAFLDAAMSIPNNMMMEEDRNQRQQDNWGVIQNQQSFNSAQAVAQREWTAEMSNTQYQRAAVDASKAGLNRILAMRQGGANSSAGSAASSSGAGGVGGSPGTAHSALAAGEVMEYDKRLKKEEEYLRRHQSHNVQTDTDLKNSQQHKVEEEIKTQKALTARTQAEAMSATSSAVGAANEEQIDKSTPGAILRWINRISESIQGASSAARRAKPH